MSQTGNPEIHCQLQPGLTTFFHLRVTVLYTFLQGSDWTVHWLSGTSLAGVSPIFVHFQRASLSLSDSLAPAQ